MAAGVGSRLRPHTDRCSKALIPILSVPCLQYVVDFCISNGLHKLAINAHHQIDQLKAGVNVLDVKSAAGSAVSISVSDESGELLGSLGGVRTALPLLGLDQPFLRLNADRILDFNFSKLVERHYELHKKYGIEMTLGLMTSRDPVAKYPKFEFDSKSGLVLSLREPAVRSLYFSGASILEPSSLMHFKERTNLDFVQDYLRPAIARGKVGALLLDEVATVGWMDIDTPSQWRDSHFDLMTSIQSPSASPWILNREKSKSIQVSSEQWVHSEFAKSPLLSQILATRSYIGKVAQDLGPSPKKQIEPRSVVYGSFIL